MSQCGWAGGKFEEPAGAGEVWVHEGGECGRDKKTSDEGRRAVWVHEG